VETIGSKWSYALTWCMPNNDDDDDDDDDALCYHYDVTIKRRPTLYCSMSYSYH